MENKWISSSRFLLLVLFMNCYLCLPQEYQEYSYTRPVGNTESYVLYATYDRLYKAPPPVNSSDSWTSRVKTVNVGGWSNFPIMIVDRRGYLYKVSQEGQLYRENEPLSWNSVIESYSTLIGLNGWQYFKFLIFNHLDGFLYAVTITGQFYKATPPRDKYDNWIGRAQLISRESNWNEYRLLIFGTQGELYGVHNNGQLHRGNPSISRNDGGISEMNRVSRDNWSQVKKIFFNKNGILYAVTNSGALYKGWPPLNPHWEWMNSARLLSGRDHNWAMYDHIFFNPHKESVPYYYMPKGN